MSENEKWFFLHPPICNCDARSKMSYNGKIFHCFQCGKSVSKQAAMADLRAIRPCDLKRVTI